jgi:hypothetical protein
MSQYKLMVDDNFPGSSHDPIVWHLVHGPGSSHDPIVTFEPYCYDPSQ